MTSVAVTGFATCFFEKDASTPLWRRSLAEGVGTAFLMLAATAAGIAIEAASPGDPGFGMVAAFIAGAVAVAGALVALIVALGAVSGGHFNPLITLLQWLSGERGLGCTIAYIVSQIVGALVGAMAAAAVYGLSSAHAQGASNGTLVLSEVLATLGLLTVVAGVARSRKADTGPFAVGGWIAGASIALPSHCYANPALTTAAMVASGPVRLPAMLAISYIAAQLCALAIAYGLAASLYPVRQ